MILRETYQVDSLENAMATKAQYDPAQFLHEQLATASPDLLRQMLSTFIQTLMSADADGLCGAPYGVASPERTNSRNGYRHREFDTRAGTIDVAIPKLRTGSYFPEWLLERRRRAEAALTSVVATCYLLGVSTRRMEKLVATLGITSLSKSQVSAMAADLDAQVEAFRTRPLDAGPYTFVAADALVPKVREGEPYRLGVSPIPAGGNWPGAATASKPTLYRAGFDAVAMSGRRPWPKAHCGYR